MNNNQVEILKQLQADSLVFFMKLHNFHWNVKGRDFPQVHKATEEIYDTFSDIFDDLAERIIQLGSTPYVTLADVVKVAKIKEDSSTNFKSETILRAVLEDYRYFLKTFKELSKVASGQDDVATQGYADSQIAFLEKAIWMLESQLA
ncbi:DNA starvation/stationary phase protection protein [Helicobacter muridarum]|uniref:DNA starvation/stationary phase protection protein n=1 Tax=Helicobacter muridarum TaxID=216 RepID=A0A099U0U1_9HELI|nr:DNA starvation/stationary phase protection protein [Helicobacter muridarum]TLE00236.1 DNA starvation/stationary phase protection protein [Helicobacter muridarum]STQ85725.1 neutrophil-activating protein [Helicobacter muridarum]